MNSTVTCKRCLLIKCQTCNSYRQVVLKESIKIALSKLYPENKISQKTLILKPIKKNYL